MYILWSFCLVSLAISKRLVRDFLKSLESMSLPGFAWVVCVRVGYVFTTQLAVYISALVFTSCLLRASRSARSEILMCVSWAHIQPWTYAQLYLCTWPSNFLGICWSFSNPLWASHSPDYPFRLFISLLFAPIVVHHFRQPQSWTIFCNCCWKTSSKEKNLGEKFSPLSDFWVRSSTEDRFSSGFSREARPRSHKDNSLEMWCWMSCSFPLVAARLLIFNPNVTSPCWGIATWQFIHVVTNGGQGMASKMPQSYYWYSAVLEEMLSMFLWAFA